MGYPMEPNQALLSRLMGDVEKHFGAYLKEILEASADYGSFGLPLLDALHDELPRTVCDNCGGCCNSVSIFSIEYHRIIRDLMTRLPPVSLRDLIHRALRFDRRLAEVGSENRLRCAFREEEAKVCLIHSVRPFACRFFGLQKAVDLTPETADPGTGGARECMHVMELTPSRPLTLDRQEDLTSKIMDISESFSLVKEKIPVAFFPFEFWLFRFALGPGKAMEIYRDALVPASTPLTKFWQEFCA